MVDRYKLYSLFINKLNGFGEIDIGINEIKIKGNTILPANLTRYLIGLGEKCYAKREDGHLKYIMQENAGQCELTHYSSAFELEIKNPWALSHETLSHILSTFAPLQILAKEALEYCVSSIPCFVPLIMYELERNKINLLSEFKKAYLENSARNEPYIDLYLLALLNLDNKDIHTVSDVLKEKVGYSSLLGFIAYNKAKNLDDKIEKTILEVYNVPNEDELKNEAFMNLCTHYDLAIFKLGMYGTISELSVNRLEEEYNPKADLRIATVLMFSPYSFDREKYAELVVSQLSKQGVEAVYWLEPIYLVKPENLPNKFIYGLYELAEREILKRIKNGKVKEIGALIPVYLFSLLETIRRDRERVRHANVEKIARVAWSL